MKPFELTHLLSVSAVQPILPVMDSIAAHCDAYWSLASRTMRTARSITSGENFGDFRILAPLSIEGASSRAGAVQDHLAGPALEKRHQFLSAISGAQLCCPDPEGAEGSGALGWQLPRTLR
jgi:hypothetical protein